VALTNVFLNQIFLHFGQFYFYSRHVCNKQVANCTAITDTLTLNGFVRNSKRGLNSWKWSNLARNLSRSLTIYLSIFPLRCLQLPLCKKHSFSFWHWENDRMLLTTCVFEKFKFSPGNLNSLTCNLCSLSLLSNRAGFLVTTSAPSKVRKCANAENHQSICAEKSHSWALATILGHFQIWYRIYIAQPFRNVSLVVCLRACELRAHWNKYFLNVKFFCREDCWWVTSRTCANTLINETTFKG